ncbi:MAG: ABC transporter substrate-binding protein [Chloroflexi bacterium]|nr:ABC transporter substrate-binding protein [Chloroflexota bacterium]
MSKRNYWTRMSRKRLSRRAVLRSSARAGVGAAGLALVGCGDDDDDAQPAAAQVQQQQQQDQPQPAEQQQAQQQQQQAAEQQAEQQAQQAEAQEQTEQEQAEQQAEQQEQQAAVAPAPFADVDLDATITTAVARDGGGLDPIRSGSHVNYISHGNVYDAGIVFDPDDNSVRPHMIAPEFVDDVTMVAQVMPAMFHDGSILTADDMVFTYDRMGNIAQYHQGGETTDHPAGWTSARVSFGSQNWVSSQAVDERTWKVELHEPDAAWVSNQMPNASTVGAIFSRAYVESVGDAVMDREPMGTGPYRFVSHTDDTDFVMTRFDDHLKSLDHPVNVKHVPFHKDLKVLIRPEVLSQIAGLEAGELDVVYDLATKDVEGFIDDPAYEIHYQGATTMLPRFNLNNPVFEDGSPNPFLDIRVREAANIAVNRQAIIDGLLTGTEKQPMFTGRSAFGYPTEDEIEAAGLRFPHDPERARQLMAEAGYADGFDTTFHIVIGFSPGIPEMALAVQQDLAAIGIRLTIREYQASEYFTDAGIRQAGSGRTDGAPGIWWFIDGQRTDIQTTVNISILPEGVYTLGSSEEVTALARAQRLELDSAKRSELISQLFIEHTLGYYMLPLVEIQTAGVVRSGVRWPAGAVQPRGNEQLFAVQKLKT